MADRFGRSKDVKIGSKHFTPLIREGLIDYDTPLKEQSDATFVKAVSKFQSDTTQVLTDLRSAVERKDYKSLRRHLECLKVNAISIGARRLESICTVFKNFCDDKCEQRCKVCVEEATKEFDLLSDGLDSIKEATKEFDLSSGGLDSIKETTKEFDLLSGGLDSIKGENDECKVVYKRKRKREMKEKDNDV